MVPLMSLWMPILLAAVLVFIASSVIHMVLGYHQSDFEGVPKEDELMAALRDAGATPGDYIVPHGEGTASMKDPEFIKKWSDGPAAIITVLPSGPPNMGPQLAMWFGYIVVVSVFAAYIAGHALAPGAEYLEVFRFAGATAFAGYALALLHGSIWYHKKWSATLKSMFDGLIYALLTAGCFGWLWPA